MSPAGPADVRVVTQQPVTGPAVPRQGPPAQVPAQAPAGDGGARRLEVLAHWLEDLSGLLHSTQTQARDAQDLRLSADERLLFWLAEHGQAADQDDATLRRAVEAVKQLLERLQTELALQAVVDASRDVVLMVDGTGQVTFASTSAGPLLGRPAAQITGRALSALVHPQDQERAASVLDAQDLSELDDPASVVRFRISTGDGHWRTFDWWVTRRGDQAQGPVILTGRDVSSRVEAERELLRQANVDELTGLPNRRAIMDLTAEAVRRAGADRPVGVIMLDLDQFKEINDSLGHALGDALLAKVGPRLRACLRPSDVIARLGGDEFAVLLLDAKEAEARAVAERLAATLDEPFTIDGVELQVDASFGIAVTTARGRTPGEVTEALLRKADIAMYKAKDAGTGIAVFDAERDNELTRARLALHAELRRAVAEEQLVVHYQPVVDIVSGRLPGVEALVRWQHPERGLVQPGEFLPFAERSGLIVPMSKVVLRSAVAQAAQWAETGRMLEVAVNLSPRWLQHGDVPEIVAAALEEYGVPSSRLRLEITETVVLTDSPAALAALKQLREMGVGLSLDDFGTGYSSMTYLRSLPVDQLKVDRAFVAAMTTSPEDAVIVRTAIELGHSLGMEVIAEGIEDADTLSEIVAAGCSLAQGYYFSRPLPAGDLGAWAAERFPT